ncbi:MAG: ATP-dependent zinc metalloprotease FtsH 1, partial [Chloroflexi bacterium OLB13]
YSEHNARRSTTRCAAFCSAATTVPRRILSESREKLDTLADALIEHETLDRSTFEQLMTNLTGQQNAQTPALFDTQPPQE